MKTFINNKGEEYLFIEVPEKTIITDKYNLFTEPYILEFKDGDVVLFETNKRTILYKANKNLNKEETSIISTTKDITEEIAESIVELIGKNLVIGKEKTYKDYHPRDPWYKDSAKSSLQSLIFSLGLNINNNYLILQKI